MNATGWEKSILGTALQDPQTMEEAEDLLPVDFSWIGHQAIWAEMLALHRRGALEARALTEILRPQFESICSPDDVDIVGEDYLAQLVSFRGMQMREYVEHVQEAAVRRGAKKIAGLLAADVDDENVPIQEVLDNHERRILQLRRSRVTGLSIGELLGQLGRRIEGYRDGSLIPAWEPAVQSIKDKIQFVDKDDFVIVAARPGEGKSSWLRYESYEQARSGGANLIFNLENGEFDYAGYVVATHTGINSRRIRDPRSLEEQELFRIKEAIRELSSMPLYIETLGSPSVGEIERITRHYIRQKGINRISVDYLQLVSNGNENRVQDVTQTAEGLRAIALRYHIPVTAACQLSREVVRRGANSEPELSDLRDSGGIEQAATMVLFPVPYWKNPSDSQLGQFPENKDAHGRPLPSPVAWPIAMKVGKNRNGPTGRTGPILWLKHTNTFRTLELRGNPN